MQFDGGASLGDNIRAAFLDPSSIIYKEPSNLLKQEVQKPSRYNAILPAIAGNASQNNEIATAVGLTSTEITYYLMGQRPPYAHGSGGRHRLRKIGLDSRPGRMQMARGGIPERRAGKLMDRTALVNAVAGARYYAFSRSGFTTGCSDLARDIAVVRLVSFDDMV